MILNDGVRKVSDLQPAVSQRFAHGESPSHRHLQQVIDEAHSWGGNETEKDFLEEDLLTGATQWRNRRITGL